MTRDDYMRINFAMIDISDVVALLPDWHTSKGASLEYGYCRYIEKSALPLEAVLALAGMVVE